MRETGKSSPMLRIDSATLPDFSNRIALFSTSLPGNAQRTKVCRQTTKGNLAQRQGMERHCKPFRAALTRRRARRNKPTPQVLSTLPSATEMEAFISRFL